MAADSSGTYLRSMAEAVSGKGDVSRFFAAEEAKTIAASQAAWRKEYPDIQWKVDDTVQQGDRVGIHYTASGTHKASGKKVSWRGTALAHYDGKKLSLIQVHEDYLGRLLGLGRDALTTAQDDISGTWKGTLFGIEFVMQLSQSPPSTSVTGTLTALGESIKLSGTNTPPTVNLQGDTPKGAVTLAGTWVGDNQIQGTLNGAGFDNQPVTFTRQ